MLGDKQWGYARRSATAPRSGEPRFRPKRPGRKARRWSRGFASSRWRGTGMRGSLASKRSTTTWERRGLKPKGVPGEALRAGEGRVGQTGRLGMATERYSDPVIPFHQHTERKKKSFFAAETRAKHKLHFCCVYMRGTSFVSQCSSAHAVRASSSSGGNGGGCGARKQTKVSPRLRVPLSPLLPAAGQGEASAAFPTAKSGFPCLSIKLPFITLKPNPKHSSKTTQ